MKLKLYMLLLFCLLLTACSSEQASSSTESESDQKYKPSLDVDLEISDNDVTVKVDTDMIIAAEQYGKARKSGEGHIHMYLDNGEKIGVKKEVKLFKDLAPGNHTLKVSLHNNDHTPYDVTVSVHFEIK